MTSTNPQFEPIGESLARHLRRRGLGAAAEAAFVCAAANLQAGGLFDAVRWQGGRLTLLVRSSLVAHELEFELENLAKFLRAKIGSQLGWNEQTPVSIVIRVRP